MPEFDGVLQRASDGDILVNLNKPAGSQVRGVGIFASISGTSPNRNSLSASNRVDGYIAVIQDVDKVYIFHGDPTTNWTNTANWTELGAGSSVSSDSFSVISVSGQSNVEANGAESTVEFIAGTNINVTTDATNDTVTFATPAELTADITGNAETVTTAAQNASTSAHFVTFTDTAAGDADIFTDIGFKYKPSANALLLGAIHNPNDDEVINLGASGTAAEFTGNVTGNVTGQVSDISNFDTDDLAEGSTNLFFTSAEQTKLANIEANATADQTDAEIKTAYENNANTNAFTDAEQTKLTGIAENATANDTDANLKNTDNHTSGTTNKVFTATEQTKLSGIAEGAEVNAVDSVNTQTGIVVLDADDISDASTTNKFTTAGDITKLANIAVGATANDTDANLKNRSNHTGTQLASTISDFDTEVTNNTTVADHTTKLAVIKPKVDHISVTQAVDLDDMESDINSNTTTITNIENVLKSAFTGGGAGIYTDSNKGTSNSYLGLTSTAGVFQAGENTRVSISETSPGSIDLFVQAGSTGNESAFKAISVDGSSSKSSADIGLNGAVTVSGDIGGATTVAFTRQATPPAAIAGGLYADTSDNLYFGVS